MSLSGRYEYSGASYTSCLPEEFLLFGSADEVLGGLGGALLSTVGRGDRWADVSVLKGADR